MTYTVLFLSPVRAMDFNAALTKTLGALKYACSALFEIIRQFPIASTSDTVDTKLKC
jgi:hypothetical protein